MEESLRGLIGLSTLLRSVEMGVEISKADHVVDSDIQELTVIIDTGGLACGCRVGFYDTVENDSVDGKRISLTVVLEEHESS